MKLKRALTLALGVVALLASVTSGAAQDFRGRINGTVSDNTGAVLPGVTVTATSPALIQPQVQVTSAEGEYRFLALPPGVYELSFELSGFQGIKREGIRVVINQTLTVDLQMQVATLQETVTVSGRSRQWSTRRHDDGDQLYEGTPHRDPERAGYVGRHGAVARPADDGLRRGRLAHRKPNRLPHVRLRYPEPDARWRGSTQRKARPRMPDISTSAASRNFRSVARAADASAFAGGAVLASA